MFKAFRNSLTTTIALTTTIVLTACFSIFGCLENNQQVITPANINEIITEETVNVILLDGQSNALRDGLADAIKSELSERTHRTTEIITCAADLTSLQFHLLGGLQYKICADERQRVLSNPNMRLIGAILVQGESNIYDPPYSWPDLFKQYKNERREDLAYDTLPIVYSQLPNTVSFQHENVDQFKQNQQALSEELYNDNVRMVVTEHLPLVDGTHFKVSATPELGELLVEQLYQLMLIQQANGIAL